MSTLSFNIKLEADFETGISRVTEALKERGFGVLTRIDFDKKIKEKLNQDLARTSILGACNPKLAYEAYQKAPDTLLLIPCNVVVQEISIGKLEIKFMKPSEMMKFLGSPELISLAASADQVLKEVANELQRS